MPAPGEAYRLEGRHERQEAQERVIFWDPGTVNLKQIVDPGAKIDSTTRDTTNTVTTELREGLLLGKITSTGALKQYDGDATDGTQFPHGVLVDAINMLDSQNTARDRRARVARGGCVMAAYIIGLDAKARAYMFGSFWFDDDFWGNRNPFPGCVAKTADYTITAADMRKGLRFTNRGAAQHINFTLPAPFHGGCVEIFGEQSHPFGIVGAAAGDLVGPNNANADSIAFATEGNIVGSSFEIYANSDASKWLVKVNESNPSATVTVDSSSG